MAITPGIRNSVKAVIVRDEAVLMIRCRDALGDFYILPGGGQEPGEPMCKTVVRECIEELGCPVAPGELLFVCEYIHRGQDFAWQRSNHQIEFMFRCELPPGAQPVGGKEPDDIQVGVVWMPTCDLAAHRHYPAGLPQALQKPGDAPVYWGNTI